MAIKFTLLLLSSSNQREALHTDQYRKAILTKFGHHQPFEIINVPIETQKKQIDSQAKT